MAPKALEFAFGFAGMLPILLLTVYLLFSRFYFIPLILLPAWLISAELEVRRKIGKGIPWVGKRKELFSKTRVNWRGLTRTQELIAEGYNKVHM